jgi:glutamate N-acetyltransferase / amino-acid N-acetyltransferase
MADTKKSPLAPAGGFPDLAPIDGVTFATASAAVKYADRDDVMLAHLEAGTVIAGVFTKSSTRSAAVLDCQQKLGAPSAGGGAILVNSGNANAFTGSHGQASVAALSGQVAQMLGIEAGRVFTASTGVIGEPLPHDRIIDKLAGLHRDLRADAIAPAAGAIMTTDTFAKGAGASVKTAGGVIHISGFAKGSGMIAPDMATMLAYVFTDARIEQAVLQDMVARAARSTFNSITVDSDTSTSDTLMVCATNRSDTAVIDDADQGDGPAFYAALHDVMLDLAQQVVRDGEGATKFIEVQVRGAVSDDEAHKVALSIANSPLVKTAVAGQDPNWGRVVMAVGKSGATADRDRLAIWFGDILVAENGWVSPTYREAAGVAYMQQQDLVIAVDLGVGAAQATVWTCDLTHGYIEINADYRS